MHFTAVHLEIDSAQNLHVFDGRFEPFNIQQHNNASTVRPAGQFKVGAGPEWTGLRSADRAFEFHLKEVHRFYAELLGEVLEHIITESVDEHADRLLLIDSA